MGFWNSLRLLLWKNYKLRTRQKVRLSIEVVFPIFLFCILALVRNTNDLVDRNPECHFDAKALPSAGFLPLVQSYICTLPNNCTNWPAGDHKVGLANDYDRSALTLLVRLMENFVGLNDSVTLHRMLKDFAQIQSAGLTFNRTDRVTNGTTPVASLFTEDPTKILASVLTEIPAETLVNSSLTPFLFEEMVKIAGLSYKDFEGAKKWDPEDILRHTKTELFCNMTRLKLSLAYAGDPVNFKQLGNKLCGLDLLDLLLLNGLRDIFSLPAGQTAFENAMVNLTGQDVTFDGVKSLVLGAMDMRETFNNSPFPRLINNTKDVFTDLKKNLPSNATTFQAVDYFACGGLSKGILSASTKMTARQQQAVRDKFQPTGPNKPTIKEDPTSHRSRRSSNQEMKFVCGLPVDQSHYKKCRKLLSSRMPPGLSSQVFVLLRGFILMAPDSPAVGSVAKSLADWFNNVELLQEATGKALWLLRNSSVENSSFAIALDNIVQLAKTLSSVIGDELPITFVESLEPLETLSNLIRGGNNTVWTNLTSTVSSFNDLISCFSTQRIYIFDSEWEVEMVGKCLVDFDLLFSGIIFNEVDKDNETLPPLTSYKLRFDAALVDRTPAILDRFWNPRPRSRPFVDTKYLYYGFSFLQDAVDSAIIKLQTNKTTKTGVYVNQFPSPCYQVDFFVNAIRGTMPLFMVIAWLYSASMIVKSIVFEKEMRLKEVTKVMGLSNAVHWIAWFIQSLVVMFLSVILLTGVITFGNIVQMADLSVIFVLLICYSVSAISLSFLVSTLFNKANLAAACGGIFFFVLFLPYPMTVNFEEVLTFNQKILMCLSSNVAFGWCCNYMAAWEEEGSGLKWSRVNQSPKLGDNFSFILAMGMMLMDSVLYALLTWYIEAVFPGEYGMPRPWYFPLQRSYWCGYAISGDSEADDQDKIEAAEGENIDAAPTHLPVGVSVRNLRKVYSNGKVAVNGLSLDFYEDQCTSFLGHNGAGKTTTLSIMTGLFPQTSGTVKIYGKDITREIDEIRQSLGMCPQHNVLFEHLTVAEQLYFYGALKGVKRDILDEDVEKMLADLNLEDKRDATSDQLSGGMKRKLSIAVAFIGGSKTVVLDEPTAGVDPYARRGIWDLLLKYKKGRTVILSTHHMDEADILGDRIAMISAGSLRCCGSGLFLKKKYGSGLHLTLVLEPPTELLQGVNNVPSSSVVVDRSDVVFQFAPKSETQMQLALPSSKLTPSSSKSRLDAEPVKQFIRSEAPKSQLVSSAGSEMTYTVPYEDPEFLSNFFTKLDTSLLSMNVSSYGVSDTTLEEIFLKVVGLEGEDNTENSAWCKTSSERYDASAHNFTLKVSSDSCITAAFRRLRNAVSTQNTTKSSPTEPSLLTETDDSGDEGDRFEVREKVGGQLIGADDFNKPEVPLSEAHKRHRQMVALLIKRFHNFRRSLKGAFCEILLPALFVALAMLLTRFYPSPATSSPSLPLVPWLYGDPNYVFFSLDNGDPKVNVESLKYVKTFYDSPGLGVRCVKGNHLKRYGITCDRQSGYNFTQFNASQESGPVRSSSCYCDSRGIHTCPGESVYQRDPPSAELPSNDILYDVTGWNISAWLLDTEKRYRMQRYGGFSLGEVNPYLLNTTLDVVAMTENLKVLGDIWDNFTVIAGFQRDFDWIPVSEADTINGTVNNATVVVAPNISFAERFVTLLSGLEVRNNMKIWFNNKGWIADPAYQSVLSTAMLRANLPTTSDASRYGILTYNHPMNYSIQQIESQASRGINLMVELMRVIVVMMAFSFVPASFVLFVIEERVCDAKHLQFVSGVKPYLYWMSTFLWDMMNFCIPVFICFIIFVIFDEKSYLVDATTVGYVILLLFLFGFSVTPMMYNCSFVFRVPSTAFLSLACVNVFIGMITVITTTTLSQIGQEKPELNDVNNILLVVFCIFPQYCIGKGLLELKLRYGTYRMGLMFFGKGELDNPFNFDAQGKFLFSMFCSGTLFLILTLLVEYQFCYTPKVKIEETPNYETEDEDVAAERRRIDGGLCDDAIVKVSNLTKVYRSFFGDTQFRAVDRICFAVPPGECFGLLGVNGAGKSTTFNMITGKISVTAGEAFFKGHSVLSDMAGVCENIGYCPQFDALNALLTGREHLAFYARLRGVPERLINQVVESSIHHMHLAGHADRTAGTYSGGNKRKLSTAIALIGNPSVILLDEPTTGMDPKARRFLWNRITDAVQDGRSVILTSHSMEECEALCNRIGIMVNGTFRCLGSIQHLKHRFGEGYTVMLKLGSNSPGPLVVKEFVQSRFPGAILKESHNTMVEYQLPAQNVTVSSIFQAIQDGKVPLCIEDYGISQTTLDQVFISFAKLQKTNYQKSASGGCGRCKCCRDPCPTDDVPLNDRNVSPNDLIQ